MAKINGNELAKAITEREGKKVQVNIAQVKEVLRCLRDELMEGLLEDDYYPSDILLWLGR